MDYLGQWRMKVFFSVMIYLKLEIVENWPPLK